MANIAYVPVTKDWTLITDLIGNGFSWDADTVYVIEGRGLGNVLIIELDQAPAADSYDGIILDGSGYKIAKFKVSGNTDLYVKLNRNSLEAGINISTEEGE